MDLLENLGEAQHYLFEAMLVADEKLRRKLNSEWLNVVSVMQELDNKVKDV